jgi:hypothetical protein
LDYIIYSTISAWEGIIMSVAFSSAVNQATDRLADGTGRWVINGLPTIDEIEGFSFTREQFALVQHVIWNSEPSSLGESLEGSISFLLEREIYLQGQADNSEYGHPGSYCSSGWEYQEQTLYFWYETTSGTIMLHSWKEGEEIFGVYLPSERKGGKHYTELTRVKAGMTKDQYDRWYNSYCLGDDKIPDYAEWAEWHNTHMAPLGFERMITGEQLLRDRQIRRALKYAHGKWAQEYGLGTRISALLGYGDAFFASKPRPGSVLQGAKMQEQASLVLKDLEEATQKWRDLMAEWGCEPTVQDRHDEDEDYEGLDVDYED